MHYELVKVNGGNLDKSEIERYIDYLESKHGKLKHLEIDIDGDFVDLKFEAIPVPFERIRRITGYLVGDMRHWNNAKATEERDRVKHH